MIKCTSVITLLSLPLQKVDAATITFENDPVGELRNDIGFVSSDESGVAFEFLSAEINDFGGASDGKAIKSLSPFTSSLSNAGLSIVSRPVPFFKGNFQSISFEFGNDEPLLFRDGDQAFMQVFFAGELRGQTSVPLNRDGLLNQSISFSGKEFARVDFAFVDSSFQPLPNNFEVIDNVEIGLSPHAQPIPEPLTILGAVVAVGFGFSMKCKKGRNKYRTTACKSL